MAAARDRRRSGIRLFAVTDSSRFPDFLNQSVALCSRAQAGSVAVVLRERQTTVHKQYQVAQRLREITRHYDQLLYVADRVDLANLVGADGVHLSASGLPPDYVGQDGRDADLDVSRSGHALSRLTEEDWSRLSHVWVSPFVAARKGRPPLREVGLRTRILELRASAPHIRAFALGGVTALDVESAQRAGAEGVAAIGAVWTDSERENLLRALGVFLEK